MSQSFFALYQKSLAKTIIDEAEKIIDSEKPWAEKVMKMMPDIN